VSPAAKAATTASGKAAKATTPLKSDQASRDKALRATVVKLAGKHHMVL
jgi:hypothetical protein